MDYKDTITILATIFSTSFSAIALYFTYKVYKRENTVNNENFIYQKKYEAYKTLFDLGVDFLYAADKLLATIKSNELEKFELRLQAFEQTREEIERQMFKQSMVIDSKVSEEFAWIIYYNIEDLGQNYDAWSTFSGFYYTKLDSIDRLIKNDIVLHKLNENMFARMKPRRTQ